jgi:hypothetical protein
MNRRLFLAAALTIALGLTGCAAQVAGYLAEERTKVCLSPEEARERYADLKQIYDVVRPRIVEACILRPAGISVPAPGTARLSMSPELCAEAAALDVQVRRIGFELARWVNNPGVKPNWGNIAKVLGAMAKIVMAVI